MNADKPFHVLALSGGGFRGLYTARILADIEDHLGEPIARRFDLIAGTSIGGVLALGLACEIPARTMVDQFKLHGPRIFRTSWTEGLMRAFLHLQLPPPMQRISGLGYWASTYCAQDFRAMLEQPNLFSDKLLGNALHPVVVPTVNYTTGLPVMFKTPHHENFGRDHKLALKDIALATSAAPTYFPRHTVDSSQYVDGGIYANAPGLIALHESIHFLGAKPQEISMLSIGTMSSKLTANPNQNRRGGMLGWGGWNPVNTPKKLFNLSISSQEAVTDFMLKHWLQERYFHVDEILTGDKALAVGLDKATPAAIEALEGSAAQASKSRLGDEAFRRFLEHRAPPVVFFHGPRANSLET